MTYDVKVVHELVDHLTGLDILPHLVVSNTLEVPVGNCTLLVLVHAVKNRSFTHDHVRYG